MQKKQNKKLHYGSKQKNYIHTRQHMKCMCFRGTEISEIESLVNAISSEEVRNESRLKLFTQLIYDKKGNLRFPEQYVDEMINYCEKKFDKLNSVSYEGGMSMQRDMLVYAARIARNAGRAEQAQQLYEKAVTFTNDWGSRIDAARLALEAGMVNKAQELYENIILQYEKERDFASVAQMADEAGMPVKANTIRALEEKLKKCYEY